MTATARVYTRLSRKKEDSTSLERQADMCRAEAERRGFDQIEVYEEREGTSGFKKTVARPEFERLLRDVRPGDLVLAFAVDRLSRQGTGHLEGSLLDRLDELGATLVTLDGIDTSRGEAEELSLSMRATIARQESRNIARRVKAAADQRKASGRWHGGRLPWGLTTEDGKLRPHPETGDFARKACERLLAGESAHAVARWLNEEGVPAPLGGTWNPSQIAQWASRPSLAGYQATRGRDKRTGRHNWKPELYRDERGQPVSVGVGLVTLGEWYRILDQFRQRTREVRKGHRGGKRGRKTFLGDILTCGRCGGPMSGSGGNTEEGPVSYVCTRRINGRCQGNYAARKHVDYWVGQKFQIRMAALDPGDALSDAVIDGWLHRNHPEAVGDREAADGDVADAEAALERIGDAFADGLIDAATYARQQERLTERLERARASAARATKQVVNVTPFFDPDLLSAMWSLANEQGKRDLLLDAAERVVIHPAVGGRGKRFDPERVEVIWKGAPADFPPDPL